MLALPAFAQLNTQSYFAELNNEDLRDVAVQSPYTPFGDKTALNRYGDDGSAAMVEASGVVLWRTSDGVYRPLANTQYAKPLFVSNAECILWRNAYDPTIAVDPDVQAIDITYFRIDSASGVLRETTVPVDGNKVLDTPSITTTSAPYTLVTANVADLPPATANVHEGSLFVYRLIYTTQTPQFLSTDASADGYTVANTIAVSADGSQVVRLDDTYAWIRNDGAIKVLTSAPFPLVAPNTIIRPVEISASRFVFGLARTDLSTATTQTSLYNLSRDPVADEVQVQPNIVLPFPVTAPTSANGEVIALPNFSQQGVTPVFVTQDALRNLTMFKLVGNTATLLYRATIPANLGIDVAVTRINANPGSESIALRDATNQGIIWLHNGPGRNLVTGAAAATTNFTLINEPLGRPLFVTPGEVIVWTNALAPVLPGGSLQPAIVKHYGRDVATGAITTTEVKVLVDATDPNAIYPGALRGTQVFAPFPFTQAPELWMLETGEKLSGNSLRVRRYQLLNPTNADADGDGIRGGTESGPFYVIPGAFTYAQAVADAARRGGHLATIADAAEFTRMQTAISLWQINSPMPLPKRVVPYPLWIGLELVGATWQWQVETPPVPTGFIATNWATGEPSAVIGRNRGRLTSTQKWEAANPALGGGYLLELTMTDPLAKDTDGDGASDYDELMRLLTNPVVPNFFAPPGPPVAVLFTSPLVAGSYEGFLTKFGNGPIAGFTLSVTSKGGFTGRMIGLPGSVGIRGTFSSTGAVTSLPVSLGSALSATLSMWIAPNPTTGVYRVSGRLTGLNGDPLVFELRRPAYSKSFPSPDAGSYTIALPAADVPKAGQPNGDGYLVGAIGTDGRTKLRGYTSDGLALSWSGSEVEGDFLSFFSMLSNNAGSVGSNLFLRDTAEVSAIYGLVGESDIDGDLLVIRYGSTNNIGYAFRSGAYGSVYRPVSYSQLPNFSEFLPKPDNAIMKFIDGAFSGQDVITTWSAKNTLTIPKTQTRTLSAKIDGKSGALSGRYYYNDPAFVYAKTTGTLGGVVLQKSGEVRGYYLAGTNGGQMVLLPNLDGSTAPVTLISPRSKNNVSEQGTSYKIFVTASEPWTVTNPTSWVLIQPMSGTGNAELWVTVSGNSSNLKRTADVTIAGRNHHIEQNQNSQGGSGVTISPTVGVVSVGGGSYQVAITGYRTLNAADFFSPVTWVTVTPAGVDSATVVVEDWGYWNSGYTPRSAVVKIAGVNHTVIQDWK